MSRTTIGKRWPRSAPRGDLAALCEYCGVQWRRSQLFRDGDGLLTCPDEKNGLPAQELSKLNADGAQEYAASRVRPQSGRVDTSDNDTPAPQRLTIDDIEGALD